jgi:Fe-S cluster biosynthesis and repair protein YggX
MWAECYNFCMKPDDITPKWLTGQGVTGTSRQLQNYTRFIVDDELALRIGKQLYKKLSKKQWNEFTEKQYDSEEERIAWLEKAYPDYSKVVAAETKKLIREIQQSTDKKKLIESWKVS